jgi:hypothetical protein
VYRRTDVEAAVMVERQVSIKRLGAAGDTGGLYRVFVEGAASEPVPMAEERLGYVLGLIFGTDAPERLKEVIDGEAGQLVGRPWLTPRQEAAVRGLQFGSTSLCRTPRRPGHACITGGTTTGCS